MMDWNPAIWKDLPQEERDLIRQMAPFCAQGNPVVTEAMTKFYRTGSELQPARLYFGASVGDDLARLLLGQYHLHGWFLFPQARDKAQPLLMAAALSKNPDIAQAAQRELMVLSAGVPKTFTLSFDSLKEYTGQEPHVVVPPAVRTIRARAFRKNTALVSVVLTSCLEVIEAEAFRGCTNLRTIHLPDTVWRIEEGAFQDCPSLESIVLPKGLIHLGARAFAGCKGLKTIDLPGGIAQVEEGTFQDSGLTEAVLRSGIRSIGSDAFSRTPLEDIALPESLDFIGANAFTRCEQLTRVLWKGNRHLVGQYTLKRGNDPFRNAAHFYYDFTHNQILSHHRDPEPIGTSPHFPERDVNKETYPVV
ncbi:MAG: leucine-rich repeat domain-containing protein [Ruminiclostridium sp.]|nr:leucine-rich repeat domain-containing protein [Ruminiclostridium sp.]